MTKPLLGFREDPANVNRARRLAVLIGASKYTDVAREAYRRGIATLEQEHAAGGPLPQVPVDAGEADPEPCACAELDALGEAGRALAAIPAIERRLPVGPLASTAYSKLCEARAALETAIADFDAADRRDALRAGDVVVVRVHGAPFTLPGRPVTVRRPPEVLRTRIDRQHFQEIEIEPYGGSIMHTVTDGRALDPGDHRIPSREWLAMDDDPRIRQALDDGRLEILEIAKTPPPKVPPRIATAEDMRRKREQLERDERALRAQGKCTDELGRVVDLVSAYDPAVEHPDGQRGGWRDVSPAEATRLAALPGTELGR